MNYSPVYVWPNEAFPFRVFFDNKKLRIFIVENLQHNFLWLDKHKDKIRDNDVFLVILGSHWSEFLLKNALSMFDFLGLNKEQFFILYNDERDKCLFDGSGFDGEIINQNAWLDYNGPMKVFNKTKKIYDAIYVGRLIKVKRHFLASKVENIALVSGQLYGNNVEEKAPVHIYRNQTQLTPEEVCQKINEAKCGLILSEREGACFASSEYLLCGTPVVSTYSEGGRDVWYDSYNSIICEADEDEIAKAVKFFVENPRDPEVIRQRHINKSNYFRAKFVQLLARLFYKFDVTGVEPMEYFKSSYFHKMRRSYKPDLDSIFN